jgi:alkylation response protein AidB-like acyl-CoA dehydrogenase
VLIAVYNTELTQRVYRMASDLMGPEMLDLGASDSRWTTRYLLSIMQTIAGGTSEIRRNIIGERVLALPRGR